MHLHNPFHDCLLLEKGETTAVFGFARKILITQWDKYYNPINLAESTKIWWIQVFTNLTGDIDEKKVVLYYIQEMGPNLKFHTKPGCVPCNI